MNIHADKISANKSRAAADRFQQQQSSGDSTLQLGDNRPEAIAQRKLQEMADNSPKTMRLKALQDMANNSPQSERTAQMQAMFNHCSVRQQQPIQQRRLHVMMNGERHDSAPVQMKLKVAGGVSYDSEASISDGVENAAEIKDLLEHPETYVVKQFSDIKKLADNEEVDILTPNKHIIGEKHNDSKFTKITTDWPSVAKMGEGHYMIHETDLTLQNNINIGKKTLDRNMNAQGSGTLPLENFHTAAMARLMGYLVIVNFHQYEKSEKSTEHIKSRSQDMVNVIWAYLNVGCSAYLRGSNDATFGGLFGGKFKGNLEKYYAEMYEFLWNNEDNKAARETVEALAGNTITPDELTTKQLTQIRNLIKNFIPLITLILKESTKAQDTKDDMIAESTKVNKYLGDNADTLRGKDMQAALNVVNPGREIYMKKQIGTLPKPSLIKVGDAHLAGLFKLGVPDAAYYLNYNAFYADIKKKKVDLVSG